MNGVFLFSQMRNFVSNWSAFKCPCSQSLLFLCWEDSIVVEGKDRKVPFYIFAAIFVALFKATFVASVNYRRFHCDFCVIRVEYLLQFPKYAAKLHQVSNMF